MNSMHSTEQPNSQSADSGSASAQTLPKFPATVIAHWPTGPVPCCEFHAVALRRLAGFMGSHIAITVHAPAGSECENCKNEAARAAT